MDSFFIPDIGNQVYGSVSSTSHHYPLDLIAQGSWDEIVIVHSICLRDDAELFKAPKAINSPCLIFHPLQGDVHSSEDGNQTVYFTLSHGTHTQEWAYREDGLFLDAIQISSVVE